MVEGRGRTITGGLPRSREKGLLGHDVVVVSQWLSNAKPLIILKSFILFLLGVLHLFLVRNFKGVMISIFVNVKSHESVQRVVRRDIIRNLSFNVDRE